MTWLLAITTMSALNPEPSVSISPEQRKRLSRGVAAGTYRTFAPYFGYSRRRSAA